MKFPETETKFNRNDKLRDKIHGSILGFVERIALIYSGKTIQTLYFFCGELYAFHEENLELVDGSD